MLGIMGRQQHVRITSLNITNSENQPNVKNNDNKSSIENTRSDCIQLNLITTPNITKYPQIPIEPLENPIVQYWISFLNFGYYILLVPFKIKFDRELMLYQIKTSKIQKVIIFLLFSTQMLASFKQIIFKNSKFSRLGKL